MNKLDEVLEQYKNYKRLVKLHNWNKKVINDNIKAYKKIIKKYKKEVS